MSIIIAPVLKDLERIGLDGDHLDIATAFYSKRAIKSLKTSSRIIRIMCRLDFNKTEEWERGYIAPDALLEFVCKRLDSGTSVKLYCSPSAHVKAYVGEKGALIGSANLTVRGFGGGLELLQYTMGGSFVEQVRGHLSLYCNRMEQVEVTKLESFVRIHEKRISKIQAKEMCIDRLPELGKGQERQVGNFEGFLKWLNLQKTPSAKEIYQRAYGKGNLSGHINRNFYGIRQFLLAYPELVEVFSQLNSDTYKLSADTNQETTIAEFVKNHANDEEKFVLDTWKTYLPIECGGRAKKHGGTIGNLNRMLPLIARYMKKLLETRLQH